MKARYAMCVLIPLLATTGSLWASESNPFTPELMLQNEGIGEARFSADGSQIYLDEHLPYREKQHFDWDRDWGRGQSVLSVIDARTGESKKLHKSAQDRTWYLASSPKGSYVAFGWLGGDMQRLGVLDQKTGKETRLNVAGSTSVLPILWLSDHEFVATSMSEDLQSQTMASGSYSVRKITEWSGQSWKGNASVKVVGSGRYQSKPNEHRMDLVVVDALTGSVKEIDSGTMGMVLSASPTGGRLAYLRKTGSFDMTSANLAGMSGAESIDELVLYDTVEGNITVKICGGCSADDGSLRWSPSGRQLYFSARSREKDKFIHHHYLYDVKTNTPTKFEVKDLDWDPEISQLRFIAPILWLDEDHLAVRTRKQEAGEFGNADFQWNMVDKNGKAIRDLTAGLPRGSNKNAFRFPVAVHKGAILLIANSQLWRIPGDGPGRNLTEKLGANIEPWCAPYAHWRTFNSRCDALGGNLIAPTIDQQALDQDRIALRVMKDGVFTGEFVFLDLATDKITRLQRPTEDSEPLEISALAKAALFQRKGKDGDEVLLVRDGEEPLSLHRFNTHLAGTEEAKPILLTRREAGEDEDRNDWLLLPPGYHPGDRYPLLVYFYPDNSYDKDLQGEDLREISFLNMNIPTARGYAVLLASMKISDSGEADSNPMREMHQQLIHAAENAVAKGYVDPKRWAIMGHSYGGYGTNSVITQTGRFKAAISLNGSSNLTSKYAGGMNEDKAYAVPEGFNFGARWSESGQGRMGVPPWRDPQRYIDNSPLFWAHQITTPLMLIHGDIDFSNVNESEQLFVALHRQGKDVELVRYWGEGHVYRSPGNIADMWNRIFIFLDQNLNSEPTISEKVTTQPGTNEGR